MRIIVKNNENDLRLSLPTGLVLNRVTAAAVPKVIKKYSANISYAQAMTFIRAVKAYKKAHPDWCLVEVESSDGEYVMVKL